MAAVQIDTASLVAVADGISRPSAYRASSPADLKRRQRSPYSERGTGRQDKSFTSQSPAAHSASPDGNEYRLSPLEMTQQDRYPSVSGSGSGSASASGTATAGSSSSRGLAGEDTLTLRRREANRLAAQRFRSRKKGYQDSLEERIRILEEEKDMMARNLNRGHQRSPHEDGYFRQHDPYRRRSISPDKHVDVDIRVASLEAANRRLQDELRGVVEENERLRDEVEKWRRWERDLRETRRDEDRYSRSTPILPPLDNQSMAPPTYSTSPYPSSYSSQSSHPPLQRGNSYSSGSSRRLPSPGPRLPPLRLPQGGSSHSPHGRPLLPRPESMERLNHNIGNHLQPLQLSPPSRRD